MFSKFHSKLRDDERGFTLIELMVVVLIIGILVAIALPTFLGARTRAQNRAAQTDLRNGMAAADTYFSDGDSYANFDVAAAETIESSLIWVATVGDLDRSDEVAIVEATDQFVTLVALSGSGTYYSIHKDANATGAGADANRRCEGTVATVPQTFAGCAASTW